MPCAGFMRRTILKRTLQTFGVVALTILLSFGFVDHQATNYMVAQLDSLVTEEANFIAGEARQGRMAAFQERLRQDPRRVKPTGLFDAEGNRLAGNIESFPSGLHVDGAPQDASVLRNSFFGRGEQSVRATARRLPNGETLVVAWSTNYNEQTAEVVKRGLIFGLLPGFGLALIGTLVLGTYEQRRVSEMSTRVQRIVSGELQQRLPAHGTDEPLDRLAALVNGMLDGVTRLQRYYEPLRIPTAPGLSLAGVRLIIPDHAVGLPVLRALSLCTCCRHYPGAAAGRSLRSCHPTVSAFPGSTSGSACTSSFSRFAQRSLALRPAHSHGHRMS